MKRIVNIALCYSGLINNLDYIKTHKKIADLFPSAEKVNFTVCVHTWEYKNNTDKLQDLQLTVNKELTNNVKFNTTDYSELDSILERTGIEKLYLSDKAMKRYNVDTNIVYVDDFSGDTKAELLRYKFAQFYSQYKAFELIGNEPGNYDIVFRLRPDTIIDDINTQLLSESRFPLGNTFEEYMHIKNQKDIPSPGMRPLDYNEVPDIPIMFTSFNEGDSGLTEHGFNYADWLWYMFYKDFQWFMNQYGSAGNFVTELINQYLLQQDSNQFHGVHRFLSKSIIGHHGMIYPWKAIETSLEFA